MLERAIPASEPDHTLSLPAPPRYGAPILLWMIVACPAALYAILMLRHQPRSPAGQLVMLTQRIGKSANEFLTIEGVSPEAVAPVWQAAVAAGLCVPALFMAWQVSKAVRRSA